MNSVSQRKVEGQLQPEILASSRIIAMNDEIREKSNSISYLDEENLQENIALRATDVCVWHSDELTLE